MPAASPAAPRGRGVRLAATVGAALRRILAGTWDFIKRVYLKAEEDDLLFLAGAVAFNVLLAAGPFILLLVSIFGIVLGQVTDNPRRMAVEYVFRILPPSEAVERTTIEVVRLLLEGSTGYGLLGLALFLCSRASSISPRNATSSAGRSSTWSWSSSREPCSC